ncbi:hypothetical protein Tco_1432664, partial [Tanacetum coccineum]
RALKINVRIPRRYENSGVVTGKKATNVNNGSNNGVVIEAEGNGGGIGDERSVWKEVNEVVAKNETVMLRSRDFYERKRKPSKRKDEKG